jgi:hypothetical protein
MSWRSRILLGLLAAPATSWAASGGSNAMAAAGDGLWETLRMRAMSDPFNLVATAIFGLAVVHTFLTGPIRHWAHRVEERHRSRLALRPEGTDEVSFGGQILHFLGEVEAVFGLWVVALGIAMAACKGVQPTIHYIADEVSYTEAIFVVIIMTLASTRPVLQVAEAGLRAVASLGRGRAVAWWLAILTVSPLLGSFITEPAAMTIAALLLSRQFYALGPSPRLRYATLGLLFVNISVGGTLTHFAAPPVLMVAAAWDWGFGYMLTHFGWRAVLGIGLANATYLLVFRRELRALPDASEAKATPEESVPMWVTAVHVLFLSFTVAVAHYPVLFVGGFLFFLAFAEATAHHQNRLELRGPLLVGVFLAGLVVHGGLQAWWIEPVLRRLGELPLFFGATVLTAFNDNALITYLATLVPSLTPPLKLAVVAGAVTGGGLTVIANAPNPAGQSLLQKHFPGGISPLGLLLGALLPTAVMTAVFLLP